MNEEETGCSGVSTLIMVTIAIIIVCAGLMVFALKVDHDVMYPQVRQNIVDDPGTSIKNRQDFHTKLAEIVSTDHHCITYMQILNSMSQNDPDRSRLLNNLLGVENIRSQAISDYNAAAKNPDLAKDMESWMPKSIHADPIPSDDIQAVLFLQKEADDLQKAIDEGGN